jgi:hypothetical protein
MADPFNPFMAYIDGDTQIPGNELSAALPSARLFRLVYS